MCPCGNNNLESRSFVSNDYYCEANFPLWDGVGCANGYASDAPCCGNLSLGSLVLLSTVGQGTRDQVCFEETIVKYATI